MFLIGYLLIWSASWRNHVLSREKIPCARMLGTCPPLSKLAWVLAPGSLALGSRARLSTRGVGEVMKSNGAPCGTTSSLWAPHETRKGTHGLHTRPMGSHGDRLGHQHDAHDSTPWEFPPPPPRTPGYHHGDPLGAHGYPLGRSWGAQCASLVDHGGLWGSPSTLTGLPLNPADFAKFL